VRWNKKEQHYENEGKLYGISPFAHCDTDCPYTEGTCISRCSHLGWNQRPCLKPYREKKKSYGFEQKGSKNNYLMERGYWTGKNMDLEKYFLVGSTKERRTSPVLFIKKEAIGRLGLF